MKPFWLYHICVLLLIPIFGNGQDCFIRSKANDIDPDQLCSPVDVLSWEVSYVDVNDAGTLVQIFFDWDDGSTQTLVATEIDPVESEWVAIASHTYISIDDRCNYHPVATLMVDGVLCTSSSQEQIVTIWDNDNSNGGRVNASPDVYPICIGSGATMQFEDNTLFNCVPPQEEDVPNNRTRWIQWVYGTNISMTGTPVSVDGVVRTYPYLDPTVIELTGPVTESGVVSLPITVADDNFVGEEFEVELRYWNFCNPYPTDPYEFDRSVIRIVDFPDATITLAGPFCLHQNNIFLTAATGGGSWSGQGIVNAASGEFSPLIAGIGTHTITYQVTSGASCTSMDTEDIVVLPGPDGTITPVDPFCLYDTPYKLMAASAPGTWSGTGIINSSTGLFDPGTAAPGRHRIAFETDPDANGCIGTDTTELAVVNPPYAEFLTPDSAWCQAANNQSQADILISGTDSTTFDLVIDIQEVRDTMRNLSNGEISIMLNNGPGLNQYGLVKVIEHHGSHSCESDLADILTNEIHPLPQMDLTMDYNGQCSPVDVDLGAVEGYYRYIWDFGDGNWMISPNHQIRYSYHYDKRDWILDIVAGDTLYGVPNTDTVFHIQLTVETNSGCRGMQNDSIRVYPNPKADFLVIPEIQYFPDSEIYLSNLSSAGDWSYRWSFGDGSSSSLIEPEQHLYSDYGIYDVELKSFSPYCRDSITKSVQILPPAPRAGFEPDAVGCPPLDVSFSNSSQYADTYLWDFDDGTFSTDVSPTHTFWESKEHQVKMTAYGLNGTDSARRTVFIHPQPVALFDAYPLEVKNLSQLIKFVNNSVNSSDYLWDFGDGNTSSDVNPSHTYSAEGVYTVSLYVWSENNCPDTLVQDKMITVIAGEGSTGFPNAFIWNGSGPSGGHWSDNVIDNTVFHPQLVNAIDLKMIIFNRWGEKIFESNDVHIGWDGYLKSGELASQGVYVYKAWVSYINGEHELLTGDITFLH